MPQYDVFISYSRDDQLLAKGIYAALEGAGLKVWLDIENITSVDRWQDVTHDALSAAASVVVIISSKSMESQTVRREIALALDQGKRIVPILVGDASLPLMLSNFQLHDLRDPQYFDREIANLLARLSESPVMPGGVADDEFALPNLDEAEDTTGDLLAPPPPPAPAQPVQAAEASPDDVLAPAPQYEAPRERPARSASDESAQPPHFTAYYPAAVKPAAPYALMVFVHLDSARAQVEQVALGYAAMMGGAQASAAAASAIQVDVGSLITFVPVIEGITFDAAERVVTWQPPYQSATFLFTTPADLPPTLAGRVLVYQGPLIIGEIPVQMQIAAADQPVSVAPDKSAEMDQLQPVFASYSHRDTPVMEYFRRSYARLGQKMLVDVYDLRSGEHWADRLLDMIGESAVFQLFWSQHSAQSTYCRQEWEHALHYLAERPRFIRPVWWQEPMPTPPPELADLHFQRVPIPVLTRAQVIAAKLRGFLG